jgi:stage IV sporulation protein B
MLILVVFLGFSSLPNEIKITQGYNSRLESDIPICAEIENAPVMTVNNKPVSGNINIDFNKSTIKVEKPVTLKAKLKVMGIGIKNVSFKVEPEKFVIPSGRAVGVRIDTDGVLVLGTGKVLDNDGKYYEPAVNLLKSGDRIMSVNGVNINDKNELQAVIKNCQNAKIDIIRNGKKQTVNIGTIKSGDENKIGVWVRDSTQGIGTITFYNPQTKRFAALGHPITDVDTREIMPLKQGEVVYSQIKNVVMGEKGKPGELTGESDFEQKIGNVDINSVNGIYGDVAKDGEKYFKADKMRIASAVEVHTGDAWILTTVDGDKPQKYNIKIETINRYSKDSTKNMVVVITDEELLKKTGGIVQGMSGSPIIQDGCLVGALTHVFVQNPQKGYAVFAENMNEKKDY